jgi:saccharopine dehydrogenase-like NADP-dependent oxidoreductase
MQITIIGGRGELGQEIKKGCKKAGHLISTTSRAPKENQIHFDWNHKQTYLNLHSSKIIINAAPVKDLNCYFEFLETLLSNNQVFIETTARPDLVAAMIDFQKNFNENIPGLVVHAVGIFPGISNFLLQEALEQKPGAKSVNFNVKYSIFSKAGKDMCQLMAESLAKPSVYFENGRWKYDKSVGTIKTFEKKIP